MAFEPNMRADMAAAAASHRRDRRTPTPAKADKPTYTEAEKSACSIEAMRNGGTCESCQ